MNNETDLTNDPGGQGGSLPSKGDATLAPQRLDISAAHHDLAEQTPTTKLRPAQLLFGTHPYSRIQEN